MINVASCAPELHLYHGRAYWMSCTEQVQYRIATASATALAAADVMNWAVVSVRAQPPPE